MSDSLGERLRAHCNRAPRRVLWDDAAGLLLDLASGKALTLAGLQSLEDGPPVTLGLEGGRTLTLTDAGIAFAPLFTNTGPLEELPAAVGWADFQTLVTRLKHELYGPAEAGLGLGTVRVLMCCLAIVDGARWAGFDVRAEELELEWHLKELELRAPR